MHGSRHLHAHDGTVTHSQSLLQQCMQQQSKENGPGMMQHHAHNLYLLWVLVRIHKVIHHHVCAWIASIIYKAVSIQWTWQWFGLNASPSVAFHVHKSQLLWPVALRGQKKDCSLINPETFKSIWLLLVLGLLLTISSMAKQPPSLSVVQLFLWSTGA